MNKNIYLFNKLLILFSILILTLIIYKVEIVRKTSYNNYTFYIFTSFIIFTLSFLSLKFKKKGIYIFMSLISGIFSLYLFEVYSSFNYKKHDLTTNEKKKILNKKDIFFDDRSKVDVYLENKNQIDNVRIVFNPFQQSHPENFLPLSYISNHKIIVCNENGYFSQFYTDRHGFNNDDKVWNSNVFKYVLVGDSFTEGACVNRPKNLASALNKSNQENILNLGLSGSSTLSQYAILREYLPKNSKKILFFYYEGNDLTELKEEMKNKILIKYLDNKNFKQNLISKQKFVDTMYDKNFDKILNNYFLEKENLNKKFEKNSNINFQFFIDLLKLQKTSNLFKYLFNNKKIKSFDQNKVLYFEKIIKEIKEFADSNNSELVFVYLPEWSRYYSHKYYKNIFLNYNERYYFEIIKILEQNKINIIDIHQLLFDKEKNPLKFFPFEMPGHYNEHGYMEIANLINKKLNTLD